MKRVRYAGPIFDHCYSDDTEVLTDSGWKFFPELTYSDKLATLSEQHNLEYHCPEKLISVPWEGDLLRFFSWDGVDLLVSPNHNMYVRTESATRRHKGDVGGWKLEPAAESFGKSRYYKKTAPHYLRLGPEHVEVLGRKIKTEAWLEFLGYYLSEGSATITKRKDYIVQLRQVKNEADLVRMAAALGKVSKGKTNIRPDGRVIVNDKDLCVYLKSTFGTCYTKFIPRELLNTCSREQLGILYKALVLGGGKLTPDGQFGGSYYATSSIRLRDDFQELQFKVGLSGDITVGAEKGDTVTLSDGRVITATTTLWKVSIRRKRTGTSIWSTDAVNGSATDRAGFEKVPYEGNIYCATVRNHTLYVRRKGKAVWCGNSGYGSASRNYVLALHRAGVPISVEPHCFETNPPAVGTAEDRATLHSLVRADADFEVLIVHLTPDLLPQYLRKYPDKYTISYTVWETSTLPSLWAQCCNKADEVWVPSQWNVEAFTDSGVTVPVHKIHHGINPDMYKGCTPGEFDIAGIDKGNTFVFTSVMQWNSRKNPEGLLRAYFATFKHEEPVRLVLKAYVGRGFSPGEEAKRLKQAIQRIKSDMQLPQFPKMNLLTSSLSEEQMHQFYMYGDAYVSLTHGEGFGLTMFEAGLAGKAIIATDKGGNMEYMTPENSYPVPSMWDFVQGMSTFNPWYWGNQRWARPSLVEASKLMRHVYENREEARHKGSLLREKIVTEFSWEAVAAQMLDRLGEI